MRLIAVLCLLGTILLGTADVSHAQAFGPKAGSQAVTEQTAQVSVGPLDRFTVWVYTKQREFHRLLADYLSELRETGNAAVAWALIGASFLYGVFHAAGPGHGKTVMTGYLLSQRETVRRGIVLAVLAAFCQGLVAIFIVYGIVGLAGLVPREAQAAVNWSERASFVLVAVLGAMLLYRAARRFWRRRAAHEHHHEHDHHHDHDHAHDDCCGHAHVPTAEQVEKAGDLKTAAAVVLSIGIRPCTGAVLVLVFASATGLTWAGLAAVLAMSAGTAVTVSGLAATAVGIRNAAWKLPFLSGGGAGIAGDAIYALGGIAILWIGISLLMTSLQPAHPLF